MSKTACYECVGLAYQVIYSEGGMPNGSKAVCYKSEIEATKETGFNPISGEDWEKDVYPSGEKYRECKDVNKGACNKFEQASEAEKRLREWGTRYF